ncbi:MAG: cytochrome c oxidase subunit II [Hydrogenophilaceae bacterium]|nr:cytochrome c oxidase subunit II [Hydrogenophilaceae bacterium]
MLAAVTGVLVSGAVWADYQLNLREPQSALARDVYDIHTMINLVCLAIFIVVFGAMFYSIWKHRKSKGHQAAHFHESTTVEVIWTIIPFFILIGMAYPATKAVLAMKDTSNPDLTIKITGYQWKWEYDYLKDGVKFMSTLKTPREQIENKQAKGEHYLLEVDNELVVPVGKKVRVLLTAGDVIHSWWVPELAIKQDAIPGFIRDAWFKSETTGTFRGQCVELCGKDHAFMPIVVKVVTQEEFDAWLASRKQGAAAAIADNSKTFTQEELMAKGEKVYTANCAACHQANGMGVPGAFPAISGSKVATGPIDEHIKLVLNGRPGTAMAAFGDQLSEADIAAVVTYQRNSWANKVGDMAQPSQVAGLKGGAEAAAPAGN